MRARAKITIATALLLGGCRALLGIEDLELQADGGAGTDAGGDAALADTLVPADAMGADVAPPRPGSE